jgi:hypothetical protein
VPEVIRSSTRVKSSSPSTRLSALAFKSTHICAPVPEPLINVRTVKDSEVKSVEVAVTVRE